jgi:hypothetical protein
MPGDRKDQYRRNFARAEGSVARARVSVRKIEEVTLLVSARSVQTIFTYQEIFAVTDTYEQSDRLRSYTLLAEVVSKTSRG